MLRYLDAQPLLDFIESRGGLEVVLNYQHGSATSDNMPSHPQSEYLQSAVADMRRRGAIRDDVADRICIKILGVQPSAVWGEEWWALDDGKVCSGCEVYFPADGFARRREAVDGLADLCRGCAKRRWKSRQAA